MNLVERGQPFSVLVDFAHTPQALQKAMDQLVAAGPGPQLIAQGLGGKGLQVMQYADPAKAAAGTIRKDFGENIEQNAVHGSDAPETAAHEISFFFSALEIVP